MWFVFGGKPLRFSLREFHIITGLSCSQIPSENEIEEHMNLDSISMWKRLFGADNLNIDVPQVIAMLQDSYLSDWKKLPLALIVILDGIVVCPDKHLKLTLEYVEMLNDIDFFLTYPWGRESFLQTYARLGPPASSAEVSIGDPIKELRIRLMQQNAACYGFLLPLQLLAFETIPLLLSKIPSFDDFTNFFEYTGGKLSETILHYESIIETESDPELTVQSILYYPLDLIHMDFSWEDDVQDEKVEYLESLICGGYEFEAYDFFGGDASIHPLTSNKKTVKEEVNMKEEAQVNKKLVKKEVNVKKKVWVKKLGQCPRQPKAIDNLKKDIFEKLDSMNAASPR
ncbi:uncharacterized protein LOC112085993 [Eutrema salsugineum]|uniref:uncharacterized protein LOC112085993 n=1 Tax=Eutrema salsugineum TaxID=72664 RepID=UPI000CED23B1|nr:uncharacterized protein LOC112085993 [Eutrema salsugineum]